MADMSTTLIRYEMEKITTNNGIYSTLYLQNKTYDYIKFLTRTFTLLLGLGVKINMIVKNWLTHTICDTDITRIKHLQRDSVLLC